MTSCTFGTFLEEALGDRLVCRVLDETVQRKLLMEANLLLVRAFKIVQGLSLQLVFVKERRIHVNS